MDEISDGVVIDFKVIGVVCMLYCSRLWITREIQ